MSACTDEKPMKTVDLRRTFILKIGRNLTFLNRNYSNKLNFLSHLLFISVISSVILAKGVEVNTLPTDNREKSMHYFLRGHK